MSESLFVPYELGIILKGKGFDEPCWAWWHIEDCDTRFCYSEQRSPIINSRETEIVGLPLYQQVVDWFSKNHKIHIHQFIDEGENWFVKINFKNKKNQDEIIMVNSLREKGLLSYNKAFEKALELI